MTMFSMNNGPLMGRSYAQYASPEMRQLAFAQRLMQQGADASPVRSPLEGLARALQGGIGGYFANQAETKLNDREKAKQQAIANALSAGMGQSNLPGPNPDGSAGYNVPGDMNKMAAVLAGNPDTAQMALPLAVQNMQYQQGRQDKLADTASQQGFQKEMLGLQQQGQEQQQQRSQAFQLDMAKINQAFQSGQLDKQQAFAATQAAENREQQRMLADKQLAAQQPTRDLTNMLTGQKIQENQQKITDAAKSKEEAVVSTDRMIRSIDDLANHPGLESAVGFGYGKAATLFPGTDASSFEVKLDTLKSQAFLPMVAQLKGMGQLSDAEGKKLTAAIGALDTRMSEKEFKASLAEIKGDLEAARKRMGAPEAPQVPRPSDTGNLPPLPPGYHPVP